MAYAMQFRPGVLARVAEGSGIGSGASVVIITKVEYERIAGKDSWRRDHYKPEMARTWIPVKFTGGSREGKVSSFPASRLHIK